MSKILTVEIEISDDSEVAICFNEEGIKLLMEKLHILLNKKDHIHLMTPSWAGNELTEEPQGGKAFKIINSLRLVRL